MTEIISALPPEVINKLETLIIILKAVGIIFIIYFVYLVSNWIINWKRLKRLKFIENEMKTINQKLDILLKGKKEKRKK